MMGKQTVLVVDDEPNVRQVICTLLQEEGFDVIQAADGVECLRQEHDQHPDLVVLDILMPHKDGREACRQLREASDIPILVLTALPKDKELVSRFADGADDYITKPFDNGELVARIRALLRRAPPRRKNVRQYDDGMLCIDLNARQCRVRGETVKLSPKEWMLVEVLLENRDKVVSLDELFRRIWGANYAPHYARACGYPKVYIAHLRRKLRDPVRRSRYIHTERELGYRFETHN